MTPSVIELANFRLVAQGLNELRHRVPLPTEGPHVLDASVRSLFARDVSPCNKTSELLCHCVAASNRYFLIYTYVVQMYPFI